MKTIFRLTFFTDNLNNVRIFEENQNVVGVAINFFFFLEKKNQ